MNGRGAITFAVACLVGACATPSSHEAEPNADGGARVTLRVGQAACDDVVACARACEGGDAEQCKRLGDTYAFAEDGGADESRALRNYERACELRSGAGCLSAGHFLEYGRGTAKDATLAVARYQRGCDVEYVPSCVSLAVMLREGRGVSRDTTKANQLFRNGCDAGARYACDRLSEGRDGG